MSDEKLISVCRLLWSSLIIVGTAYIVFGLGHSAWWFLLAVLLLS